MIEVEVDCNNNNIIIYEDTLFSCKIAVRYPSIYVRVIEEILNRIPDLTNFVLTKIEDDSRITMAEW